MDTLVFVFSGQGNQSPGMGKELFDELPAVRDVFERHELIRPGTKAQCFSGDAQTLNQTINAQPCLFTLSFAIAAALEQEGVSPCMLAGFSLGEISALAFADVFSSDDGFRFVCQRAEAMQKASFHSPGGMAAVLKLSSMQVEALCKEIGNLYPVNYNCPQQVVVAGSAEALAKLAQAAASIGGRALPLKVSGAFHSPLMDEASLELLEILKDYHLSPARLPVFANMTAQPYTSYAQNMISNQVNHPVLWQETIENMIKNGVRDFIEVGAGSTLCGLIGKIDKNVSTMHIHNKESFDEAIRRYAKEPIHAEK